MASQSPIINQNGVQATSGFEMCFAMGSQHLWYLGTFGAFGTFGAGGPNQNTSQI